MKKIIIFLFCLTLLGNSFISLASASTFNPDLILTDEELTNYNAMNLAQIKDFLVKKGSTLANYLDNSAHMFAHQIIYDASQLYQINPKYALVLLQKEQSLITDPNPVQGQYDWATGYGACDGCNGTDPTLQKYKGFYKQIDNGVGAIRFYLDNPDKLKFKVGQTYTIDNQSVTILNHATRALYNYTPHLHGNEVLHNLWTNWFALTFPNGTLIKNSVDKSLWLIQNNLRRPFLSKAAFVSRYSLDKLITVKPEDLEKYEIGPEIKYPNYSLLRIPSGGVYLLEDDSVRPITSGEAFRLLGFNPEEITDVKEDDIASYVRGEPITIKSSYPTGTLLQDKKTGGVYYVKNGIKYPLIDKKILTLYYANKKIIKTTAEELAKYETGAAIKLRDGELAKSPDAATVYFISDGAKRPIANVETLISLGYKFSMIITVPQKILDLHPDGETINTVN
ncbi:MAG TPA: hypothetical protein PKZ16_02520 [bacterium]|nr:hypothetical protein [bacterium]HPL95766.1 hypothetical protein [bacterium]